MESIFQEAITNLNVHIPNKPQNMCYWWITRKLITSISDLSFDSCIHPWTSAVIKIVQCIFIILKPFSEGAVHIEVEQQVWKWLSALPAGARTCCDITFCCAGEAHQRVLNGGAHSWLEEVGPESTYPRYCPSAASWAKLLCVCATILCSGRPGEVL